MSTCKPTLSSLTGGTKESPLNLRTRDGTVLFLHCVWLFLLMGHICRMRVVSSEHFQGTVVPSTSQIMATPQIMAVPLTSTELAPRSVLPVTDNRRPHRFIRPSTCYSRIWSKIFLIALFDTADFDTIIGFLSGYINDYTVRNLIETRNTIRAVSCMWDVSTFLSFLSLPPLTSPP